MKYELLVLNELLRKKYYKWLLIYFILFIAEIFLIYRTVNTNFFVSKEIEYLLGIPNLNKMNLLELLLFLYQVLITIYFSYSLYIYDYNHSQEFVFLRMNQVKRNVCKLSTITLFICSLRIIYFFIIFILFNKYFSFTFIMFIKNIFYYLIIIFFVFLIQNIYLNFINKC